MPTRTERANRSRGRRRPSELDWFAEDPWAEPDAAAFDDDRDSWHPSQWDPSDEEAVQWNLMAEDDDWDGDSNDGWSPVRRRSKRHRRARQRTRE